MLKGIFKDRAMKIQAAKIAVLGVLLALPWPQHRAVLSWTYPTAIAKKDAKVQRIQPELQQAKKEKKPKSTKKSKKKKPEAPALENHLSRTEGRRLIHHLFKTPAQLEVAVDFWKMVYTRYDRQYEIFHDTDDLGVVYSVLDFSDLYKNGALDGSEIRAIRRDRIADEKDRIRSILQRLHDEAPPANALTHEEKTIYDLFKDNPDPDKFHEAKKEGRLRSQTGIKNNFMNGIAVSGAYLEEIEDIFTSHGIPMELTRLIFVESMFNTKARSKVGASGIWQFMPSTGRLFLNIDAVADERNDPILASHAAARLLKNNYEALGTWPLAINAYNSGRATMRNAVNSMGTTDIATIIRYYRGGVYGFASRNFYPSFLAALEVANQYPKYFGEVKRRPKLKYEHYYLKNPNYLSELCQAAQANHGELISLNPHFSETILSNGKKIPAGYSIRIPHGMNQRFSAAEAQLLTPPLGAIHESPPGM